MLSLSAVQELKELVEEADALWPALPDKIAAYDEWLEKAKVLVEGNASHPGVMDHEAKLAEIRLRAKPPRSPESIEAGPGSVEAGRAVYEFEDPKDRWWHAQPQLGSEQRRSRMRRCWFSEAPMCAAMNRGYGRRWRASKNGA